MSSCGLNHESIADIPEDKLVERLLADPLWRNEYFELYGNPSGTLRKTRVSLPTGFQGDADIVLFSPKHPDKAVAVEVKRIKFGVSALRPNGRPNKLHEYAKAIEQASRLHKVGFWKVYPRHNRQHSFSSLFHKGDTVSYSSYVRLLGKPGNGTFPEHCDWIVLDVAG